MFTIRLGIDFQGVTLDVSLTPLSAVGLRETLAFNVLSHPGAAPGPYKALVPGEGKFHLESGTKPFLAPLSLQMPWSLWP